MSAIENLNNNLCAFCGQPSFCHIDSRIKACRSFSITRTVVSKLENGLEISKTITYLAQHHKFRKKPANSQTANKAANFVSASVVNSSNSEAKTT